MDQNYQLQQIATSEVAPDGETIAWVGQPNPLRMAMKMIPFVLFAIPWTAFSIFWVFAASGFNFPPDFSKGGFSFFPLFGLPFVLVGFGMFFSPVYQYIKAFRTIYVVTDKSVRIIVTGNTKKVERYSPSDVENIQRKEKADGSGDLIFKNEVSYSSKGSRNVNSIGFYGIPHVRDVEQYLVRLRE